MTEIGVASTVLLVAKSVDNSPDITERKIDGESCTINHNQRVTGLVF